MTIAKRLLILVAVPLAALGALGLFTRHQLSEIEARSRFVAESRISSLAALGNLSRNSAELRVNVRKYLLGRDAAERAEVRAAFDASEVEVLRLLSGYADTLIVDDRERRLLDDYRELSRRWLADAREAMSLADQGLADKAVDWLDRSTDDVGERLNTVSGEWIQHSEDQATSAGRAAVAAIQESRWKMPVSNASAVLLTGLLGWLTFRRIVMPIRALETSVKTIAAGDYAKRIPFTESEDETGGLARSIDILKRGAAAVEDQRWVKSNAARLSGDLQGASSLAEFGQRLLSGLVPVLGGGIASLYTRENQSERWTRVASYGLAGEAQAGEAIQPGEGLVGQCARDRRAVTLAPLPGDYCRIASGLGNAPPIQVTAWPLVSRDVLLGVVEFGTFRGLRPNEQTLMDELLPVVAMSLEILQRNLSTRELLAQTQEQARQLEEQTGELTQSHEELLRQQRELTAQRESLQASEERTRLILESSAEGIFGVDTQGRIGFVNAAACRLLGFTAEEMIGQPSHALIHHHHSDGGEFPVKESPMFAACRRGEASQIDVECLWRKNGSALPVQYGATPMRKDGAIVGAVISFTDITERQRAAQELANRLAFQESLLETIPYPMFIKDADGRFVSCNQAYQRAVGTRLDFLVGKTVLELDYLPEEERRRFHEEDLSVIRETGRRSYELPIQYSDGQTHVTLYSVDGFRLCTGQPGGLIGLLVDISEQKRVAGELSEAKAKAEEATQMKSLFLANMSHEIRTPMNAIIGLSHLALKTPLTAKQRDYLSKIHHAGTSLLGIINDILDFSKIEAGRLDLETTDFRLDDVIRSVTTITVQKAQEKGLEFLADVSPAIPETLRGDPLRLGQILTNLVNNAVKFTERGEIRLRIEWLGPTGDKVQLRFSVRDTGIGMTREQAAKLFQPFSQADMSTTRKHCGTGLGLTISRRLVELMGGRIWLESEAGAGSTFTFTVWLEASLATGAGRPLPGRLQKLRVLVVDDHAAAREILVESIAPWAERVDAVSSGHEAIAALRERNRDTPYDVVFMDWQMPGLDGLQTTRLIKNDATLRQQPAIIMVTAFGREEVREQAEQLPVDGFLLKPVTRSMILDSLMGLFGAGSHSAVATVDSAQESVSLRGARILLAEDNEINQQIAIELLESAGAVLDVARNGRIAVEKLADSASQPYDLVLMDLQMPEMDGYQATARIRAEPRLARLPIIAMTAHATLEERDRCLAAGMNDHVSKPINPDLLFETLARFYQPPSEDAFSPRAAGSIPVNPPSGMGPEGSSSPRLEIRAPEPGGAATEMAMAGAIPDFGGAGDPGIPTVEGMDTGEGLLRVAGNRKLYLSLLRQFVTEQDDAPARIEERMAAGDPPTAERIAHSVRGVAGNLGARTVQAAAAALEQAIRTADPRWAQECRRLEQALRPLLDRLRLALGEAPSAVPAPDSVAIVDAATRRETAARMLRLLAEFDPAATDCLDDDEPVFRAMMDAEGFARFKQHVEGYAFAEARTLLEQAVKERGR
ncbi:MAG: response regulator [Limisphaerales bacterium]